MSYRNQRCLALVLWALVVVGVGPRLAHAQAPDDLPRMVKDWNHYVFIDQQAAAKALGDNIIALFGPDLSPTQWANVLEDSDELKRFQDAIVRASKMNPELERVAARLDAYFQEGKRAMARNPGEIGRSIGLLRDGDLRHKMVARERLREAGEYAMPQLLRALMDKNDPVLRHEVEEVMIDLGRQAVGPLMTALPKLDEGTQMIAADLLGKLKYETSLAGLVDLRDTTKSDAVRDAADRAIRRIRPSGIDAPASVQYLVLADSYYQQRSELTSFPGETHQLVWNYNPQAGLDMTPVRTEVYHETMSMRFSEDSLRRQAEGNSAAIAQWVAANLKREIESPEGYSNPVYPPGKRDAMYYAVAAGSDVAQRVLERALEDRNTPLARRALAALEQTLSATNLQPRAVTSALSYPNRRVQLEAALVLGGAQPQRTFDGSDRVVPVLASAVRDVTSKYAVILASDREVYAGLRQSVESLGYTVLPRGSRFEDIRDEMSQTPGVDLIVSALGKEATAEIISEAHASPVLTATPILAMMRADTDDTARRYAQDNLVEVRSLAIQPSAVTASVEALVERASGGPISAGEAMDYQARALTVLRDLAVSGNQVFRADNLPLPLMAALDAGSPFTPEIAAVLSRIDQGRVQVALMDAALKAPTGLREPLLEYAADSARRFGNRLEQRQVQRLITLAREGEGGEATTAAAVMGALNLPNTDLVPLLLGKK